MAVAALVLHFMPDPLKGVWEMVRIVKPAGIVAAYAWDLPGGGFPHEAVHACLRQLGSPVPNPPHPEAGGADEIRRLWSAAALVEINQRKSVVSRKFSDFDQYWQAAFSSPRLSIVLEGLSTEALDELRKNVRTDLPA